jgi:hypothetical protein
VQITKTKIPGSLWISHLVNIMLDGCTIDIQFKETVFFALVPENLNSRGGPTYCGKTLILLLWSLHWVTIELRFLSKETMVKFEKKCNKFLRQKMSYIFKKLLASLDTKLNKKSLNKFDAWVSMFRLSRWLCQGNVFVLIFDLVQHVAPLFCSGYWHN